MIILDFELGVESVASTAVTVAEKNANVRPLQLANYRVAW
jgi:hypothetical protein